VAPIAHAVIIALWGASLSTVSPGMLATFSSSILQPATCRLDPSTVKCGGEQAVVVSMSCWCRKRSSLAASNSCRPLMRSMSDRPSRSTDQAMTNIKPLPLLRRPLQHGVKAWAAILALSTADEHGRPH
jgi:hypothetical protein